MKRFICLALLMLLINLNITPKPICISLGADCEPAIQLRDFNLRQEAYPFDWLMIHDFRGLYTLLAEHFQHFLDKEWLEYRKAYIYNKRYDIKFFHDFPLSNKPLSSSLQDLDDHMYGGFFDSLASNFLDYLPTIAQKYKRRIKRFYIALQSGSPIYFFRTHYITPFQARKLVYFFTQNFPYLNFKLIAIHSLSHCKGNWNIPHVESFYIDPKLFSINLNEMKRIETSEWIKIFKKLRLIS